MAILAPLDADELMATGLASPPDSTGTRRIHKRRLNRSSDEENSHIPLIPVSSPQAQAQQAFVGIPEDLVSLATLRYIGYRDDTASMLWERWTHWPPGPPAREVDDDGEMPFIEFALGPIENPSHDVWDEEDDQEWRVCMNRHGISDELQDAIMDPIFTRMRLVNSCLFWVADSMELRYRGLEAIQQASREREVAIKRASTRPGSNSGSGQHGGSSSSQNTSLTPTGGYGDRRSVSASQRLDPGIENVTAMSATALSASNAPGYLTLYKGIAQTRIEGLFDINGNIDRIGTLFSTGSRDFSRAGGYYFALDREIAVYYANYAKRRDPVDSVVIIQLQIPHAAIEGLSETELVKTYWPSTEWKETVYYCRRGERLPPSLIKFKKATLITGTIARRPNKVYQRLSSASQITENNVLKTKDGQNAVQFVWSEDDGEEFLIKHCQRLKVYPLTSKECMEWRGENEEDD